MLIGSTLLGIALIRNGSTPKFPAWLLTLSIPLAISITQVTSLGSFALPVMFAFGILGHQMAQEPADLQGDGATTKAPSPARPNQVSPTAVTPDHRGLGIGSSPVSLVSLAVAERANRTAHKVQSGRRQRRYMRTDHPSQGGSDDPLFAHADRVDGTSTAFGARLATTGPSGGADQARGGFRQDPATAEGRPSNANEPWGRCPSLTESAGPHPRLNRVADNAEARTGRRRS